MTIQRGLVITTACFAFMLDGSVSALAHAHLVRAAPAAGATLKTAPEEISLRFNEKLEAAFSSVVVRDANGKQVDKGDSHLDKADRATMRISLPPLTPGVYTVEWRATSSDTHKVNGNFTFQIGQ